MNTITRRGVMAAFASLSAGAASAKSVEPERSLEEQAIWHMQELYRLIEELGPRHISVMAIANFGHDHNSCKLIGLTTDRGFMNRDGMFAQKGGAA